MANKHQVLELLAKGLNPQEVARELGCSDAYVRATRKRAEVPGYHKQFASHAASTRRWKDKYKTLLSTKEGRETWNKYLRLRNNGRAREASRLLTQAYRSV